MFVSYGNNSDYLNTLNIEGSSNPTFNVSKNTESYMFTSSGNWEQIDYSKNSEQSENLLKEFKVMTYNVLKKSYYMQERIKKLLELVEEEKPEIICLQEVTPNILKLLISSSFIQKFYILNDVYGEYIDDYGVITMVRTDLNNCIVRFTFHAMQSRMNRYLIESKFRTEKGILSLLNGHFESLDYPFYRVNQMKLAFSIGEKSDVSLVVGDFNFGDDRIKYKLENETLESYPQWHDCGKDKPFDTVIPDDRQLHSNGRVDRMLCCGMKAGSLECLGREPFMQDGEKKVHISDHFGLACQFTI
jgi:endonuclease/exonuclease/phosphatase family metal-dependent hydrolase